MGCLTVCATLLTSFWLLNKSIHLCGKCTQHSQHTWHTFRISRTHPTSYFGSFTYSPSLSLSLSISFIRFCSFVYLHGRQFGFCRELQNARHNFRRNSAVTLELVENRDCSKCIWNIMQFDSFKHIFPQQFKKPQLPNIDIK